MITTVLKSPIEKGLQSGQRLFIERGSEWKRWDLHIHTPGTALEDRFKGDWDAYFSIIESKNDVAVLGITDYLSITNYSKVRLEKYTNNRIQNICEIFPNIEFRISPQTSSGQGVNLHLLISPDDPSHENEINRALEELTFSYSNGRRYRCTKNDITRLGKDYEPSIQDDASAYREGVNQFKIEQTAFFEWYDNQAWLKVNSIIIVSGGKDGIGGLSFQGGFGALRINISARSHAIFSANPQDRNFWLGKTGVPSNDDTLHQCGGQKACLHGCDAHDLTTLLEPAQKRYCWIKADPTFDGLRQILAEPADRVFIGEVPPIHHVDAHVIESVSITSANDLWFGGSTQIPLNRGLVSIVGARGSGKSALAELIAYAAGGWSSDQKQTFIERAKEHLDGTKVTLAWVDGKQSEATLNQAPSTSSGVRYLSQRFVEQLCSEDHAGGTLATEVEKVVFSHIPIDLRYGTSSFNQLRSRQTAQIYKERSEHVTTIEGLITERLALRDRISTLPAKRIKIQELEENSKQFKDQIDSLAIGDEAIFTESLAKYQSDLESLNQQVASLRERLLSIDELYQDIASFDSNTDEFIRSIKLRVSDLGLVHSNSNDILIPKTALLPTFSNLFEESKTSIQSKVQGILGNEPASEGTVLWTEGKLKELETQVSSNQATREKIQSLQTQLSKINGELNQLRIEVKRIEESDVAAITNKLSQIWVHFGKIFESFKKENDLLTELYKPVEEHLNRTGLGNQQLSFYIRQRFDTKGWNERIENLFDGRRFSSLPKSIDEVANIAEQLQSYWSNLQNDLLIESVKDLFIAFDCEQAVYDTFLKKSSKPDDILRAIVSVASFTLEYGLRYNNTELDKLSPGTKGIVLLILYLILDVDDTRPLIVDQPEENLDNESVYSLLVPHFREAKKRRQIFLVTHNPNLVVNTDSEQVIIAECDKSGGLPCIRYSSGPLEDCRAEGIRDRICGILEGGKTAFQKREERYGLAR
ncbi:MAG: hypothetical protein H2174_10535 [Vampirovibrio sp.]|nr:hypothetical protein [Vampirovibrio sp.]